MKASKVLLPFLVLSTLSAFAKDCFVSPSSNGYDLIVNDSSSSSSQGYSTLQKALFEKQKLIRKGECKEAAITQTCNIKHGAGSFTLDINKPFNGSIFGQGFDNLQKVLLEKNKLVKSGVCIDAQKIQPCDIQKHFNGFELKTNDGYSYSSIVRTTLTEALKERDSLVKAGLCRIEQTVGKCDVERNNWQTYMVNIHFSSTGSSYGFEGVRAAVREKNNLVAAGLCTDEQVQNDCSIKESSPRRFDLNMNGRMSATYSYETMAKAQSAMKTLTKNHLCKENSLSRDLKTLEGGFVENKKLNNSINDGEGSKEEVEDKNANLNQIKAKEV